MAQNEKYIAALKRMQGGEFMDPASDSEGSGEEQQHYEEIAYGQKIFFTDGGHTNKVSLQQE